MWHSRSTREACKNKIKTMINVDTFGNKLCGCKTYVLIFSDVQCVLPPPHSQQAVEADIPDADVLAPYFAHQSECDS